jgi:DNA-binding transcriptional regulator YhcF (GntR family)
MPQFQVATTLSLYYSTDRLIVLEAIVFRIDAGSDVPIYRQLVHQVRRDVMLGRLRPGDQLPSVKEVVDALAVNPNTVVKAFGELEHQGMVVRRQGVGTFVAAAPPLASLTVAPRLLAPLARWVERARKDGLSAEQIRMLLEVALDEPAAGEDERHASGGAA